MIDITPPLNEISSTPLYIQLYEHIKEEIENGHIKVGTRLPSIRKFAQHLRLSKNTIESCYRQLLAEGYIVSHERSGMSVVQFDEPLRHKSAGNDHAIETNTPIQVEYEYPFTLGEVDQEHFPFSTWRKLSNQTFQDGKSLLSYGDKQGEFGLRSEIAKYLRQARGVHCTPEQIVIGAGTRNVLNTLFMIMNDIQEAAIEDPCYLGIKSALQHHGVKMHPLPLEPDGIKLEALYQTGAQVVFVTPSHQFPSGAVMPIGKRMKLLNWAVANDAYIIEDDYDSEFKYDIKPVLSFQGLDVNNRVIYFGTFSKSLFASIRVAYMVLPPNLLERYRSYLESYDTPQAVPRFLQRTLQLFMEQGYWEKHLRRMRTVYKKKHQTLINTVKSSLGPNVKIIGKDAGLHLLLEIENSPLRDVEIVQKAKQQGIKLYPYSKYCLNPDHSKTKLILGFGGLSEAQIEQGIKKLGELMNEMTNDIIKPLEERLY